MPSQLIPRRVADDVFEVQVAGAEEAQALANSLRSSGQAEDVVAGLSTVAIRFDPADETAIVSLLKAASTDAPSSMPERAIIEIEINYGGEDGPDFELVCQQLGLSEDAFIEQHAACEHKVDMIGFTPGFSYVSGVPSSWAIPRLSQARNRVAAGSVGMSAGYTGIYALAGPGGWPIIGRTRAPLFDAKATEPFLLTPGQRVRFRVA